MSVADAATKRDEKRQWGEGPRIFVSTAGHRVDVLENDDVRTITQRGLLRASR